MIYLVVYYVISEGQVVGGQQVERGQVGRSWLINIPRLISRSSWRRS